MLQTHKNKHVNVYLSNFETSDEFNFLNVKISTKFQVWIFNIFFDG